MLDICFSHHMNQQQSLAGEQAAPSPARQHIENTRSSLQTPGFGHLEIICLVNVLD
jgi:hypothetical protein